MRLKMTRRYSESRSHFHHKSNFILKSFMVKNAMKMRSGITVSFLPPLVDSSVESLEALEKLAQVLDRCGDIQLLGFALMIGDCYGIDAIGNLWIDRNDGVESWIQFLRQVDLADAAAPKTAAKEWRSRDFEIVKAMQVAMVFTHTSLATTPAYSLFLSEMAEGAKTHGPIGAGMFNELPIRVAGAGEVSDLSASSSQASGCSIDIVTGAIVVPVSASYVVISQFISEQGNEALLYRQKHEEARKRIEDLQGTTSETRKRIEDLEDTTSETYGGHATEEQYREAANRRLEADVDSEEGVEVYSEGEMAPREDFSGHHQGDGRWEPREALTFDTNLASMHTYLGGLGEVEDVGNDRFSGVGGAVLKLPMFYLEGIVLFPGQKLPLRVLQQRFKAAVHHAMDPVANDAVQTLGVIHVRVSRNGRIHVANYGTTAKIVKAKEQRDGSVNVMTKGGQRFRILSVWTQPDGALFAQVQIIEEDTKTLGDFPRHLNNAFGSMASAFNRRNGRDKQYSSNGESQISSVDEFVEEPEVGEQHGQHQEGIIGVDQVVEEDADAEDGVFDEDRSGDHDGDESDDLIAALTGEEDGQEEDGQEEDGQDSSDEDDDGTDSHDERPQARQRLNTGSFVGRRLEAVGREPTEGRNRKDSELQGFPLEEVQSSSEERGDKGEASDEEQPAQSIEDTVAEIAHVSAVNKSTTVPVSTVRAKGGPYANAYRMWQKDASRWTMRAQLTAWPHWVYRQYDPYDLARRAADMLGQMGDHPRLEELVSRPTALSYYIGSNMPIQDHTRQELLEIDSTLARLKREIQLLEGIDTLRCNCCGEVISWRSDVFVMSTEGAIGAYVNAHGYVHETLTLSCARNLRIQGAPQTENSWFPGYAWILAKCQGCHMNRREQHMGWRFIAVDPDTRPQTFWGIRRTQLIGSSEAQPPDDWD